MVMGLSDIDRIISVADNVEADLAMRDGKRPYSCHERSRTAQVRQQTTTATAAPMAVSVISRVLIIRCMFILSNEKIRRSLYNARFMYHKERHRHKGNGRRIPGAAGSI